MLNKTLFVAALISLTTACSSLPVGKSAKQLYLEASTRHAFTKSYNFKQTINGSDFSALTSPSFLSKLDDSLSAEQKKDMPNIDKIMKQILQGFKAESYGAYDPKRGMMEMIYGVEYSQNNVNASIRVPMLLNWKDPSLTLGPSLLNYLLLPDSHDDNQQGLVFKLSDAPEKVSAPVMRYLNNLVPVFLKNTYDGFSVIDETRFKFKPREASDDAYKASRIVSYSFSLKELLLAVNNTLTLSLDQLENDLVKTTNNAQRMTMLTQEELNKFQQAIGKFKPMLDSGLDERSQFAGLLEEMMFSGDMYLDGWGRPKHIVSHFKYDLDGVSMSYATHTEISNYGAAQFTLDSEEIEYFNGAEIIKKRLPELKRLKRKAKPNKE